MNGVADNPFYNVPISIMASDVQKAQISLAIKVISAKTRAVADAKGNLKVIYFKDEICGFAIHIVEKK